MPQIPLPQQGLQVPGRGVFTAPAFRRPTGDPQSIQFARMGQAMQKGGLQLAEAAFNLEIRTNVAAVKEAAAIAEEKLVDSDVAFMSLKGKPATGDALGEAQKEFEGQLRLIRGSLAPGDQQERFTEYMTRRMPEVNRRWAAHYAKETAAYDIGSSQAFLESLGNSAIRQGIPADQPELMEGQEPTLDLLAAVENNARRLAEKVGKSPDEVELYVLQHSTRVIAERVSNLADSGRSTAAREYLEIEGNRDKMTPEAYALAMRRVRAGSVQEESALRVDTLIGEMAEDKRGDALAEGQGVPTRSATEITPQEILHEGLARLEAMRQAGETTPEMFTGMRSEIERRAGDLGAAEAGQRVEIMQRFEVWAQQPGNAHVPLTLMPPSLLSEITEEGLMGSAIRYSRTDKNYATDVGYLLELQTGGAGEFSKTLPTFTQDASLRLSPSHLASAVEMWKAANKQPAKFELLAPLARVKAYAIDTLKLDMDDEEGRVRYGQLLREVESRANAKQSTTGQPATSETLDEILGDISRVRAEHGGELVPFALIPPAEQPGAVFHIRTPVSFGGVTYQQDVAVPFGMIPPEFARQAKTLLAVENEQRRITGRPLLPDDSQTVAYLWAREMARSGQKIEGLTPEFRGLRSEVQERQKQRQK